MKRTLTCFLLLPIVLLHAFAAQSQEVFVPPPAKPLTKISFIQLTGGIIIVRAALDDFTDSLNFVFDTGSGGISLDSATCQELHLDRQPSQRTIRGIAGVKTVDFANNHSLKFPGLTIDSLNFHINDYELLSGVYGIKIDGIIGYSVLSRYIIRIDYDEQQLQFLTRGSIKYPRGGYLLRPTIAGLPMQSASVRDNTAVSSRFFLDTGAGLCLLLSDEFCTDSALLSPKRKRYKTVAEGLGGKKEMFITVLKEFKIGSYKFRRLPVYVFDDEFNVTSYPYLGGLIGNDLLRRFNVTINYAAREFYLVPNSHFREQFDFSYSGLGLFATATDIIVSDVIDGSPADEAGFKVGDVIVGMNNTIGGNMTTYRGFLQQAGTKIRVIFRREGQLQETKLNIKKIL